MTSTLKTVLRGYFESGDLEKMSQIFFKRLIKDSENKRFWAEESYSEEIFHFYLKIEEIFEKRRAQVNIKSESASFQAHMYLS